MTNSVFISSVYLYPPIHPFQFQCNPNLNCKEQYKKEIGHNTNILQEPNHSKLEHNINNHQ